MWRLELMFRNLQPHTSRTSAHKSALSIEKKMSFQKYFWLFDVVLVVSNWKVFIIWVSFLYLYVILIEETKMLFLKFFPIVAWYLSEVSGHDVTDNIIPWSFFFAFIAEPCNILLRNCTKLWLSRAQISLGFIRKLSGM